MELGTSHESLRLLALLFTPVRRMQAGDLVSVGATARRASQSEEIIFLNFGNDPEHILYFMDIVSPSL